MITDIKELILDLEWEYDRMSTSGKKTLDKLFELLDLDIQ